ncbi:MAG: hypothetical protein GEU90_08380 [Gemmatimonas sp.]|nr:hypothetical protein [Gemmatimonas sp.]
MNPNGSHFTFAELAIVVVPIVLGACGAGAEAVEDSAAHAVESPYPAMITAAEFHRAMEELSN